MITTEQYQEALQAMRGWSRVWILAHTRPDGDAIGAMVGARQVLRRYVPEVTAIVFDAVTPRYEFLVADDPLTLWDDRLAARAGQIDGLVLVDTCARNQLEPAGGVLERLEAPIVVFDHHQSRDLEVSLALIDPDASATCVLIAEWAQACGVELDRPAKLGLFTGMAADTGWFRFANADRRTYELAARLIGQGIRPAEIYRRLYCSDRPQRLALLGKMLGTLELYDGGRCAVAHLTQEMIRSCAAQPGDQEELSTELGRIGSVVCWALLTELPDGRVRVNLRSKHSLDMARLAEGFGGGGHPRAAGARLPGSLREVKELILARLVPHSE